MEHLPVPENHVRPNISIPLIRTAEDRDGSLFDDGDYMSFPLRRFGFNMRKDGYAPHHHLLDLESTRWLQCGARTKLTMIQAWLYFGLLRTVFGPHFQESEFVRPEGTHITSAKLTDLLNRKWQEYRDMERGPRNDEMRRVTMLVTHAEAQLEDVELWHTGSGLREPPWPKVLLGICALTEALALVSDPRHREWSFRRVRQSGVSQTAILPLLERRSADPSWCEPRGKVLAGSISLTTFHFLASLPRPTQDDHTADHTRCAEQSTCVALNTEGLSGRHTSECRCCDNVRTSNPQSLAEILAGGAIPVVIADIVLNGSDIEISELRYEQVMPDTVYTAISHVWFDGLGNSTELNEMPRCQLKILLRNALVAREARNQPLTAQQLSLSKPTTLTAGLSNQDLPARSCIRFWLDTYCVPIGKHERVLRQTAIDNMTQTYLFASQILVLDSELQTVSSDSHPAVLLSHVLLSGWKSRYWTHQELVTARTPLVQFADATLVWPAGSKFWRQYEPKHDRIWQDARSALEAYILWELCLQNTRHSVGIVSTSEKATTTDLSTSKRRHQCSNLAKPSSPASLSRSWSAMAYRFLIPMGLLSEAQYFRMVWNDFVDKTSSKDNDMHSILGNMLGLDVTQVEQTPNTGKARLGQDRMKAILHSFEYLPIGLLLDPITPGLRSSDTSASQTTSTAAVPDGWLPSHPGEKGRLFSPDGRLKVTPRGCQLDWSDFVGPHPLYTLLFVPELDRWPDSASVSMTWGCGDVQPRGHLHLRLPQQQIASFDVSSQHGLLLLLENDDGPTSSDLMPASQSKRRTMWFRAACLVYTGEVRGGPIVCCYVGPAQVRILKPKQTTDGQEPDMCSNPNILAVDCQSTPFLANQSLLFAENIKDWPRAKRLRPTDSLTKLNSTTAMMHSLTLGYLLLVGCSFAFVVIPTVITAVFSSSDSTSDLTSFLPAIITLGSSQLLLAAAFAIATTYCQARYYMGLETFMPRHCPSERDNVSNNLSVDGHDTANNGAISTSHDKTPWWRRLQRVLPRKPVPGRDDLGLGDTRVYLWLLRGLVNTLCFFDRRQSLGSGHSGAFRGLKRLPNVFSGLRRGPWVPRRGHVLGARRRRPDTESMISAEELLDRGEGLQIS